MVVMIVVAINVSAMRTVARRPDELTGILKFLVFGSMPMASLLAANAIFGPRHNAFRRGFQSAGFAGLAAGIACYLASPWVIGAYLETVLDSFGDATGLSASYNWATIEEICIVPMLLLVPPLLAALAGGWALSRRRRDGEARVDESEVGAKGHAGWIRSVAFLLVMLAIPVLTMEGILRRSVDPQLARLEHGCVAALDFPGSTGYYIPFPEGDVLAPNGTTVRVEEDGQPSVIGQAMSNGTGPFGDLRRVKVTVLDGTAQGRTAEFFRCNLTVIQNGKRAHH